MYNFRIEDRDGSWIVIKDKENKGLEFVCEMYANSEKPDETQENREKPSSKSLTEMHSTTLSDTQLN